MDKELIKRMRENFIEGYMRFPGNKQKDAERLADAFVAPFKDSS